jgi:hypothetical protein
MVVEAFDCPAAAANDAAAAAALLALACLNVLSRDMNAVTWFKRHITHKHHSSHSKVTHSNVSVTTRRRLSESILSLVPCLVDGWSCAFAAYFWHCFLYTSGKA